MNDLCLVEKLTELIDAGVACFKIEGRLKNADWVSKAVGLYRRALKGEAITAEEAASLGDYAGRQMSRGYLDGAAANLLGENARPSVGGSAGRGAATDVVHTLAPATEEMPIQVSASKDRSQDCKMVIDASGKDLVCTITCGDRQESWTQTKSLVRHEKRGLTLDEIADWLKGTSTRQYVLKSVSTNAPELLVPRKSANQMADAVSSVLNRLGKPKRTKEKYIDIQLPDAVRQLTEPMATSGLNRLHLGQKPNKVRIEARFAKQFLQHAVVDCLVVDDADEELLKAIMPLAETTKLVAALPTVFFEDELPKVRALVEVCATMRIAVEVNGWDGWQIAREFGVEFEGGPGLAVLNPLAAQSLAERGFSSIWYSPEADGKQLEDLASRCPVAATLGVFGRPVLVYTRAPLPGKTRDGVELADSRGIHVRVQHTPSVTRLRTIEPYCLAHLSNNKVRAQWLCADLTGSPTPRQEWDALQRRRKMGMPFNYERGLY